ncbi:integrase catalytic domain-containing protein [Trichonephila clavipes]|nr:integrase catalytic domain-containing protein [Trichonephila clavipes]
MNPADIACRGLSPKELSTCVLWWEGPQWLSCEMDSGLSNPREMIRLVQCQRKENEQLLASPVAVNYTSQIVKARVGKMKNLDSKGKYHVSPLTTYERRQASNKIFLYIQNLFFKEEISCIKANKPVVKKKKYRATTSKQLMGDLPTHRVTPSRPFSVCGVDYAGPINILRYRGAKTTKGYIALFVCFVTKALHLELVSDLTPEAFIASLKRFCARRGAPKHIYCDNGTTFVGARRKLLEIFKFVSKLNENEHFCYFLSQVNIEWHFSPPVGEIVIIKEDNIPPATWPLGKVIETHPAEVENFEVPTSGHFLIGRALIAIVEPDLCSVNTNKLDKYRKIAETVQNIWKSWKKDYPNNLQARSTWQFDQSNVKINTVVLLKEDNIPIAH